MDFCQYEYSVTRKSEGVFGFMKLLLILLYVTFSAAYFAAIYITRIFTLGALIPVALWILVYFTWRYVKQDYKYEISGSILTFSVIYGNKKPKKVTEIRINTAKAILPLADAMEEIAAHVPKKIYSAIPQKDDPDSYAMLYTDEGGKNCVFLFKATNESLRILHVYNQNVKIQKTSL